MIFLPTALLMSTWLLTLRMCPKSFSLICRFWARSCTGMGAAGFSYEEMAKRIALTMGGFGYDLSTGFSADASTSWQKMIFSFKALYRNLPEAINIVSDILCAGRFERRKHECAI